MAHIRQQLRAAAATMIAGSALCGNRVETSRARPVKRDAQPAAYVYTPTDRSNDISVEGTQQRVVRLKIDVFAKGDEADTADDLDAFGVFVEQQIAADPTFGGIATVSEYRGTDINSNADGEKPFSVMSITFDVTILTLNSDPENAL